MAALQTFDQALRDSAGSDGDAWADHGVVCVGRLASELSDDELALVGVIWSDRPLLWQKHCAQVLGQARHVGAIQVLMDFVDGAKPEVVLAALESLSEFDPGLLIPAQASRVKTAIEALLERPVAPLHQALLEQFLNQLTNLKEMLLVCIFILPLDMKIQLLVIRVSQCLMVPKIRFLNPLF